eukprot:3003839-Lingulodinium_polyedra.AAC.1
MVESSLGSFASGSPSSPLKLMKPTCKVDPAIFGPPREVISPESTLCCGINHAQFTLWLPGWRIPLTSQLVPLIISQ